MTSPFDPVFNDLKTTVMQPCADTPAEASQQREGKRGKNRWGMLSKQDMERKELSWDDFDHEYTIELGEPTSEPGRSGSTLLVFEKGDTSNCLVLRSCAPSDFKTARKQLVELARTERFKEFFLSTKCVFTHKGRIHVGSEYSDISLAEIIDGPFDLREAHVALVLRQESYPLEFSCT